MHYAYKDVVPVTLSSIPSLKLAA